MISKHVKHYPTASKPWHCTSLILCIGAFAFPAPSAAEGEFGSDNRNVMIIMPSGTKAVEFGIDQYISLTVRDAGANATVAEIPLTACPEDAQDIAQCLPLVSAEAETNENDFISPAGTISTFDHTGDVIEPSAGIIIMPYSSDVSYQWENSSVGMVQQILNACDRQTSVQDCMTSIGMERGDASAAAPKGQ